MPVFDSDAIFRVNYDPESRTLFVVFASQELYAYFDYPPEEYDALLAAESKGRFFHERIRDRYRYHKVE